LGTYYATQTTTLALFFCFFEFYQTPINKSTIVTAFIYGSNLKTYYIYIIFILFKIICIQVLKASTVCLSSELLSLFCGRESEIYSLINEKEHMRFLSITFPRFSTSAPIRICNSRKSDTPKYSNSS
jgi:hypothetical protein